MAKKKASQDDITVAPEALGADAYSDECDLLQAALRKNGGMMTHDETLLRLGGIAMPSLCLRYLFCQDTLPFGRIMTLSGLFRSNKTALSLEMSRWLILHGGMCTYNSVEEKDSPGMREAIFRHNAKLLNRIGVKECHNQEEWQQSVSTQVDVINNWSKKNNDKMCIPGVSIVDSVAAAVPKAEVNAFMKEKGGAGYRGYATVALLNSSWMSNITHLVSAGPHILLLIQHSSEQPVEGIPGATVRKQKGGMEIAFSKTTSLEMTRIKDLKETDSGGGVMIEIKCTKNSLGPTGRAIRVNAKWWWVMDPETGLPQQHYVWDWHDASIELLLGFEAAKGRSTTWKSLKDICDLHVVSGRRVWSRALGIPQDSPVKYREASEILEYDHPELLKPIYELLHIERRPMFVPGGDLNAVWKGRVPITDLPLPPPYGREPILGVGAEDE